MVAALNTFGYVLRGALVSGLGASVVKNTHKGDNKTALFQAAILAASVSRLGAPSPWIAIPASFAVGYASSACEDAADNKEGKKDRQILSQVGYSVGVSAIAGLLHDGSITLYQAAFLALAALVCGAVHNNFSTACKSNATMAVKFGANQISQAAYSASERTLAWSKGLLVSSKAAKEAAAPAA